jgi:hypothetical protein
MSLPGKDLRLDLTESLHAVLEAESLAFGRTMQSIATEVLQSWADKRAHAFKVYGRRLMANGLQLDLAGFEGDERGSAGKGRR